MRGIPEHDATEGRELAARRESDVGERGQVDVATASSARRGCADIDLDVLVDGDGLRPVVPADRIGEFNLFLSTGRCVSPLVEVPVIRVRIVDDTAVVVVWQGSQADVSTHKYKRSLQNWT